MRYTFPTFALLAAALTGCGINYEHVANELRDKNLQQEKEIASLRETVKNQQATLAQRDAGIPHLETFPPERLAGLFTAGTIIILPRSDTDDWTGDKSRDGFRIFLRVTTSEGTVIPATGTLTLEAFDLAITGKDQRLGEWTFTPEQMKKSWYTQLGSNYFAFNCPLASPPAHPDITFKAKFVDALTGNVLTAQINKRVTR